MYNILIRIFQVEEMLEKPKKIRIPKKITKIRLQNVALYYLKRFDTTVQKLREVLKKRVRDYAHFDKDFDSREAYQWIEEILEKFAECHYLDDSRYAENKVRGYLASGKSRRYIENKLREKGVEENVIGSCFDEMEYNPYEVALSFARKKKIGGFRNDEEKRKEMRQKDMGVLVRAGFEYDVVMKILDYLPEDEI